MHMPRVTILLPVHNGENYLAQSVGSVLKQDLQDFELHILDDDSSDGSASIAESTGDPRFRYSRNSSRFGLFKTLNRGFEEARTELIRIWSHDDCHASWKPSAICGVRRSSPLCGNDVFGFFYD